MYKVRKTMEISAMHHLNLDYQSPCINNHGHNWIISIEVSGHRLNQHGMLLDFKRIKELIHQEMDHNDLNQIFDFNPTAENIATWVRDRVNQYLDSNKNDYKVQIDERDVFVPYCSKVIVQESQYNIAEWSVR